MTKNLAKLLDQPEKLVAKSIEQLESLNGYNGEDARFLAANIQAARQKIRDLDMDPDDTTGEELYRALLVKFHNDSALIDKAFGVTSNTSDEKRLYQALKLTESAVKTNEMWVLKPNAAKNLLRGLPPKKLMKVLNYRSVESMLKHETIAEVYLALPYAESSTWLKNFAKAGARLDSASYELRAPAIAAMTSRQWSKIAPAKKLYTTNNLIGVVGLWPSKDKPPVLTLALMVMDGLEQLTHAESVTTFAHINPSLVWWEQAKSLIASCEEHAVTLNFKDVALDHLQKPDFAQRTSVNGRSSFWNKLVENYQNKVAQVEEKVAEVGQTTQTALKPKKLAVEYAEAIANEF